MVQDTIEHRYQERGEVTEGLIPLRELQVARQDINPASYNARHDLEGAVAETAKQPYS